MSTCVVFEVPEMQKLFEGFYPVIHDTAVIDANLFPREKIRIPPADYAKALVCNVIAMLPDEENPMNVKFAIGTKVRSPYVNERTVIQYGVVEVNSCWLVLSNLGGSPFDTDGNGQTIQPPEYLDIENTKSLSAATFVHWFDRDGNKVCAGWHSTDQLKEIK